MPRMRARIPRGIRMNTLVSGAGLPRTTRKSCSSSEQVSAAGLPERDVRTGHLDGPLRRGEPAHGRLVVHGDGVALAVALEVGRVAVGEVRGAGRRRDDRVVVGVVERVDLDPHRERFGAACGEAGGLGGRSVQGRDRAFSHDVLGVRPRVTHGAEDAQGQGHDAPQDQHRAEHEEPGPTRPADRHARLVGDPADGPHVTRRVVPPGGAEVGLGAPVVCHGQPQTAPVMPIRWRSYSAHAASDGSASTRACHPASIAGHRPSGTPRWLR